MMRWWMPPVIGIGAVALANVCLFAAVARVHTGKVEAHPYAASVHEDDHLAALHAFASRGWRLDGAVDAGGATLRLVPGSGAGAVEAAIHLYRPDEPALDRDLTWGDPAAPLHVDLPRPGAWQVMLHLRDRDGVVLASELALSRP